MPIDFQSMKTKLQERNINSRMSLFGYSRTIFLGVVCADTNKGKRLNKDAQNMSGEQRQSFRKLINHSQNRIYDLQNEQQQITQQHDN